MTQTIGAIVGPYRILAPLGAGGMGEVYRAYDEKLQRDIALKVLLPDLAANSEHLRRFEQEARAASALNHPGIVAIYDVGSDGGTAYIAMELVEGRGLRALIQEGSVAVRQVLRISAKIADALAAAHERGIVHRDLKPENVMVSGDGFVKILDFGLAKLVRPFGQDEPTMPHTRPGSVFGTVGYMSPEQASGKVTDFRSDQFSLGVIVYEMLAQRRPFEEQSAPETMTAIIRSDPPPVARFNEAVPPELERILHRCLAKDPADRYASTRDLARDLRELRDHLSVSAGIRSTPPPGGAGRGLRLLPAAAIVSGLLLTAATVWFGARLLGPNGHRAAVPRSLGMLPFRDSGGPENGSPFADGVAEMVSSRLVQANAIRIAPMVDVPAGTSLSEAARRHGADLLLRGTVQRAGGELRISYAIVDPRTGVEIAGDTVTGPETQVFQVEDTAAEKILRSLRLEPAAPRARRATGLEQAGQQTLYLEALGLLGSAPKESAVDAAIAKLQRLLIDARDSADVNSALSRALLMKYQMTRRNNYLDDAALYATRAVKLDSGSAAAHLALGNVRRLAGQFEEAMTSYRHALELQPNLADAVIGTADTFVGVGRAADAQRAFDRAIALRPDAPNYFNRYGAFCYARGNYAKAAELFRRMTELLPEAARGWANLGGALSAQGRYEEAVVAYERSISIAPTGVGWSNLGTTRFLAGRYSDACAAFEKAAAISPGDYRILLNLGDAYRWSEFRKSAAPGAYTKAVAAARSAIVANPKDALAHATIAIAQAKSGESAGAREEIRAALTLDPTNADVVYFAAVVAALDKDGDRAAEWLRRAAENGYPTVAAARDPDLAELHDRPDMKQLLGRNK